MVKGLLLNISFLALGRSGKEYKMCVSQIIHCQWLPFARFVIDNLPES